MCIPGDLLFSLHTPSEFRQDRKWWEQLCLCETANKLMSQYIVRGDVATAMVSAVGVQGQVVPQQPIFH